MKMRPSLWNFIPFGQPSSCVTRSQLPFGSMRKMRPKGMSTIHRFPSRSKEGPSRKHSTSAPCRFGSDHFVRPALRYLPGMEVKTSVWIFSTSRNGLNKAVSPILLFQAASSSRGAFDLCRQPLGRERQVPRAQAERVVHGVGDRGARRPGGAFAGAQARPAGAVEDHDVDLRHLVEGEDRVLLPGARA